MHTVGPVCSGHAFMASMDRNVLTRNVVCLLLGLLVAVPHGSGQDHVLDMVPDRQLIDSGLGRIIDRQLVELGKGAPETRGDARTALRRLAGRAAVPFLQREIRAGKNRANAVGLLLALDGMGGEETRRFLRRVLMDSQFNAREQLAAALLMARIPGAAAVRDLGEAIRHASVKNDALRIGLALAVARRPEPLFEPLVRRWASRPLRADPAGAALVVALAAVGAPETLSAVRVLGRSGTPRIRRAACLAAARLTDRTSRNLLAEALGLEKNDPWTAVCAMVALAIRNPDGIDAMLFKSLTSSEEPIRHYAALALGWYKGQRTTRALKHAYRQERKPAVRAALIQALARLQDTSLLGPALDDPDAVVRAAALLLALHADKEAAVRAVDQRLVRETDHDVIRLGLAVRLEITGKPLPADHRLRKEGMTPRILRESLWRDLDRYGEETRAPVWRWARRLWRSRCDVASPEAVRNRLLDGVMLELLDLAGQFQAPERRVVSNWKGSTEGILAGSRNRSYSELDRANEDIRVWLIRHPFFGP